jgi:PfaD family protein
MAPAADMFEMGVQVQVLRKGSFFPGRAARLYQLYRQHRSVEEIPPAERQRLRTEIFRHDLDHVWAETLNYLRQYHPAQVEPATTDAKRRLGLLFRWYLGMSARWATTGEADRAGDYQIWCGPAMGAFNDWVRATALEPLPARRVADVAHYLLRGAAFHARLAQLRFAGVRIPSSCGRFRLPPLTSGRGAAGPRSERTLLPASTSQRS